MTDRSRWQEQCDAARSIRERFGAEKAMGYLLGEKLHCLLREMDADPSAEPELQQFVGEARSIFSPAELRRYFLGPRAVGPLAHVLDAEDLEVFRAARAVEDDVVSAAEDAIRFERMRRLIIAE